MFAEDVILYVEKSQKGPQKFMKGSNPIQQCTGHRPKIKTSLLFLDTGKEQSQKQIKKRMPLIETSEKYL